MVRAAIDLGTNTFHLLIADVGDHEIRNILWQERRYVFLAENGIDHLPEQVLERALAAITYFRTILDRFGVTDIRVVGTEALRKSDNGRQLSADLSRILQAPIHIISGEDEALLIAKGVQIAMGDHPLTAHAVDIGGGSTELITFSNGKISGYISQVCGIGYLYNRFHDSEPIPARQLESMRAYIRNCYENYFAEQHKGTGKGIPIIGVAGSFEVLEALSHTGESQSEKKILSIPMHIVKDLLKESQGMIEEERGDIPGMPPERKKYIVEALTIMDEIIDMSGSEQLMISRYSIKHGLLFRDF